MNKQQKAYALAKAKYEALKDAALEIEQRYIAEHNIVNADGEIPTAIYCIDDDEIFDKANEATAPEIDALGIVEAEKTLRDAEDALINYGLSIMPTANAAERETLRNCCFGVNGATLRLKIRQQVLDLVFKLNTRTVPKATA